MEVVAKDRGTKRCSANACVWTVLGVSDGGAHAGEGGGGSARESARESINDTDLLRHMMSAGELGGCWN